jgi:hypothetical protein
MALFASLFDVAFNRCQGDAEILYNLLAGFALVDGTQNSFS